MDLTDYALNFIGTKYSWGGNTPGEGFDCSSFVCEVLRSKYTSVPDMTAQQLYHWAKQRSQVSGIQRNSILFFGKSIDQITHVELAANISQTVGAGGEGREETTKGFVRIRNTKYRTDLVAAFCIDNP